jgi:hypothetical protein
MFDVFPREDGTWGVVIDNHATGAARFFSRRADAHAFVAEVARAAVRYSEHDPAAFLRQFLKPELPAPANADDLRVEATAAQLEEAEIAAKSLRRAHAAIREAGADNIALVLQGHLIIDAIVEAGLAAQPKTAKPAAMTHPDNRS